MVHKEMEIASFKKPNYSYITCICMLPWGKGERSKTCSPHFRDFLNVLILQDSYKNLTYQQVSSRLKSVQDLIINDKPLTLPSREILQIFSQPSGNRAELKHTVLY